MIAAVKRAASALSTEMVTDPTQKGYEYHQDFSRISASMLKVFSKGRREYEATFITGVKPPKEPNPRMNLGSVVHSVFLEGEDIDDMVVRYPEFALGEGGRLKPKAAEVRRIANLIRTTPLESLYTVIPSFCVTPSGARSNSRDAKLWFADNEDSFAVTEAEAEQLHKAFDGKAGKRQLYVMKQCDYEAAKSIVDVLLEHDFATWCQVGHAIAEEPIYWTHKGSGLQCRCLPDILIPECEALDGKEFTFFADLKITINWSRDDFRWYLSGRGRGSQQGWIQAGHYADGITQNWGRTSMRFVCANPEPPHQVRIHPISTITFDAMRDKHEKLMVDLARCYETGDWSDPDESNETEVVLSEEDLC